LSKILYFIVYYTKRYKNLYKIRISVTNKISSFNFEFLILNFGPKHSNNGSKNNSIQSQKNDVKIKNCQKMENKFSYSHSKVHVTNLWPGEHRTATSGKKMKSALKSQP
jgi:hypothetical protein